MRILLNWILVTFCLLATLNTARADRPTRAQGTFGVESIVPFSVEPVGDFCVIELNAVFDLDGTFDGLMDSDFAILHFGPCDEPAPELFYAEGRFTGSVNGATGTLDYVFFGEIDAAGNADGDLVILEGTGDLSQLRGRIRLQGVTGIGGTYSGWIRE